MVKDKISELSICGGALPLDFLNTVSEWLPERGSEYLATYRDYQKWVTRLDILSEQESRAFAHAAAKQRFQEKLILNQVRALRLTLYDVFSGIVEKQKVNTTALQAFNKWLKKANEKKLLAQSGTGTVAQTYSSDNPEFLPLWHIISETEKLLLDPDRWPRIRMCPACGWFFFDTSKGGKRKWCDMLVCGSRDKALRYYRKTR